MESSLDFTHLKKGEVFDELSLCDYNLCMWMNPKCGRSEVFLGYFMNRMRKHPSAKTVNEPEISHEYCTLESVSMLETYELVPGKYERSPGTMKESWVLGTTMVGITRSGAMRRCVRTMVHLNSITLVSD